MEPTTKDEALLKRIAFDMVLPYSVRIDIINDYIDPSDDWNAGSCTLT